MVLVAAPARAGNWLDTDQPLADPVLADIAAAGYQGVIRYVPLPNNPTLLDISAGELERICAATRADGLRLQCLLIQHPRLPANCDLTKHSPQLDGQTAAQWCASVGYPAGCHLGLDCEGLAGASGELTAVNTPDVCIAWASVWQHVVIEAGFRAMLYEGYDVPLTPVQLYQLPGFDQYWSDAGHRRIDTRGVSITQGGEVVIHGVKFDRDVVRPDLLGDAPWACQLSPEPAA